MGTIVPIGIKSLPLNIIGDYTFTAGFSVSDIVGVIDFLLQASTHFMQLKQSLLSDVISYVKFHWTILLT